MTGQCNDNFREMAWNGVRFNVPDSWEISRMGSNYLQLEDDDGPVFELKWRPVRGRFSLDTHFKKVAARQWRRQGVRVEACELPATWAPALERYAASAFKWQAKTVNGMGVVLFCSQCQTALLLQFLRRDIVGRPNLCAAVLSSLSDHEPATRKGKVRWAVYDFCVDIPDAFKLRDYRFIAGAFSLTFDGPGRSAMSLHRWGPASMVLTNATLGRFVTEQFAWARRLMAGALVQGDEFVHLDQGAPASGPLVRWWRRLRRKPHHRWLHAWHDKDHNRILAVDARGAEPLPRRMLEQVSDGYVVL